MLWSRDVQIGEGFDALWRPVAGSFVPPRPESARAPRVSRTSPGCLCRAQSEVVGFPVEALRRSGATQSAYNQSGHVGLEARFVLRPPVVADRRHAPAVKFRLPVCDAPGSHDLADVRAGVGLPECLYPGWIVPALLMQR